ncbi:UNVERIFIED_CONTAM: hypothetical protein RF653_12140 [Kocuria sp. CPCC 205316]|uniref:hypothetical protein n=1 Tax=Kocuria TaxID=57493 RepID=UPI0036DBE1B4
MGEQKATSAHRTLPLAGQQSPLKKTGNDGMGGQFMDIRNFQHDAFHCLPRNIKSIMSTRFAITFMSFS